MFYFSKEVYLKEKKIKVYLFPTPKKGKKKKVHSGLPANLVRENIVI